MMTLTEQIWVHDVMEKLSHFLCCELEELFNKKSLAVDLRCHETPGTLLLCQILRQIITLFFNFSFQAVNICCCIIYLKCFNVGTLIMTVFNVCLFFLFTDMHSEIYKLGKNCIKQFNLSSVMNTIVVPEPCMLYIAMIHKEWQGTI